MDRYRAWLGELMFGNRATTSVFKEHGVSHPPGALFNYNMSTVDSFSDEKIYKIKNIGNDLVLDLPSDGDTQMRVSPDGQLVLTVVSALFLPHYPFGSGSSVAAKTRAPIPRPLPLKRKKAIIPSLQRNM